MPIVISPAHGLSKVESGCNYADPEAQVMQETPMSDLTDIIEAVKNYDAFIHQNLPNHADEMIYYSNFRVSDIKRMLSKNPDSGFIRIYIGRRKDGSQFTIAMPVEGDSSGRVKQAPDTEYLINCCACKPNCGTNFGF